MSHHVGTMEVRNWGENVNRGMYGILLNNPAYSSADKEWLVALEESKFIWYDLLQSSPSEIDTKKMIVEQMKELEQSVKNHLDKRFIYFLGTRKRVRFCTSKPPRYSLLTGELVLYLEIGRAKKNKKISIPIYDGETGRKIKPRVEITEKYIRIFRTDDDSMMFPVHDFLNTFDLPIGENTEVHYVGYTSQPSVRPLNGVHKGLNRILYHNADGDQDFFLIYNLFKVMVKATAKTNGVEFLIANSMLDEIEAEVEGKILEKALIAYFNTPLQDDNRVVEDGELKNGLQRFLNENRIASIRFQLEMEEPNEYFRFFSKAVPPADCHCFICALNQAGEVSIEPAEAWSPEMPEPI